MADKAKVNTITKDVLKEKAESKTKVRLNERVTVEITKDTKHFSKGYTMDINPAMAEVHVKGGYAKIVK